MCTFYFFFSSPFSTLFLMLQHNLCNLNSMVSVTILNTQIIKINRKLRNKKKRQRTLNVVTSVCVCVGENEEPEVQGFERYVCEFNFGVLFKHVEQSLLECVLSCFYLFYVKCK